MKSTHKFPVSQVGLYLASAVVFTASVQFAKDDEDRSLLGLIDSIESFDKITRP